MLLLTKPKAPGGFTYATGSDSSFTDVLDASWESTRYAYNANSRWRALEEAYDRRIQAVHEATGQTLDNPLRALPTREDYIEIGRRAKASGKSVYLPDYMDEKFQRQIARIAESNPDKLRILRPQVPTIADAIEISNESERKLTDVLSRSSGLTGTLANLAGGVGGTFEDPTTYALLPVGLAGSASKSLLWNALRAAASNAAGQAIVEPFIQQWRKEAGLEAGILPGLKDIAFAGAVGGGLDFAVRGLVRGGKAVTGADLPAPPQVERGATIEEAIPRLPDDNPIKAAAAGDDAALVTAAQKIEGHLSAAERGALRQLELETSMKIDAGEDLAAIAQAIRHAEDPHVEPPPAPRDPVPPARGPRLDDETPAPVKLGETFEADGKPVAFKTIDPLSIGTDAAAFQFKGGGDAAGVTDRLRAVKRWDDLAAGKAVVFERADGSLVIADGHQRLGLAKRLAADGQNVKLTAFVMREADGWTPSDVRALAAKKNMQEGTGSAIDAAKIMRERPDLIDETVPVTEGKLRMARHLARLEPEAFDAVVAGVVPETWGALVGETVADPSLHKAMLEELARADIDTADQARLMIAEMQQLPTTVEHQLTLFGETTSVRPLIAERAKVLSGALQQLARDAKVFATLDREAGLVEAAGNVLARDANAVRATKAQALKALVEELALKKGRVSDMLSEAALAVSSGAVPIKRAAEAFARRVGAILDAEGLKGLTDDVVPPAPRGLDEPAGPEVKAEVEQRVAEVKSRLGKGLDQITKETKGGQAAVDRVAGRAKKPPAFSLIAWHGSAKNFERFSTEYLRSGEGAMSFGRGLYFTETKAVAETYRKVLSARGWDHDQVVPHLDGKPIQGEDEILASVYLKGADYDSAIGDIARLAQYNRNELALARKKPSIAERLRLKAPIERLPPEFWQRRIKEAEDAISLIERMRRDGKVFEHRKPGADARVYEVRIDAEDSDLIKFDRPLAEQPAAVRAILGKDGGAIWDGDTADGRLPYRKRAGLLNSPDIVDALVIAGVKGVKYLDKLSRAEGAGTYNFVVFDAGHVTITGREPLFSLSPAAAEAMPDVRAKLNEAAALLPKAVRIRLYDNLTFARLPERIQALAPAGVEAKTIAGLWDAEQMVIHLSLSTGDPLKTLRHEQVHMMRALGLLSDADYQKLVRHAEKTDARKTYKIDATYKATVKAQFDDKAAVEARLVEETVAHLVADRLAGKTIGGGLDKILKPIRDFLRKVRDALGLKGLRTVDDVFEEIAHGGHRFDPPSSNPKHPAWDRLARELRDAQKTGAKLPDQSDPRMVRARELGFDTTKVWYRGTNSNRQADRLRVSATYGVVYVTSDPKVANRFSRQEVGGLGRTKIDEGSRVYPLLLRRERLFDPTDAAQAKKLRLALQKQGVQISRKEMAANLDGLNEAFLERADVHEALKDLGYAGYLSQQLNVNDSAALFDPAELRSLWAEFALEKAREDGLLFSLSPDDAEAALGVRLHDAELRDKVAGAARKLQGNVGMQASWIEGFGLEEGAAEKIIKLYTGLLRDFSKTMDETMADRLARTEVADILEKEALHRKRVALLQLEATTRVRQVLSTHKNARGEVDPAQAMVSIIEHHGAVDGTPIKATVVGRHKALLGFAQIKFEEGIWHFRRRASVGRNNVASMPNVVRELFGETTGDATAARIAKSFASTSEWLRQAFNQAGGAIAKLENWGMSQAHNARALRKAGFEVWRQKILPLLAPEKMRNPLTGKPMTLAQVEESLPLIYRRIVTDGAVDAPMDAAGGGGGALHSQHAEHRFLVFKDADSWLKYQNEFGAGGNDGIFAAMMNHFNVMTRDTAAMQVLGPNPDMTMKAMIKFVANQRDNAIGGQPALFPTKSPLGIKWSPKIYGDRMIQRATDMWAITNGSANVPANSLFANIMGGARNITYGTVLGGAMLSSVGDIGRQAVSRKFAGLVAGAHGGKNLPLNLQVLSDVVQQFRGMNRREALRAGLIMESALNNFHGQARYVGSFDGPALTRSFADRMLTWTGLTPWTQAQRSVFGLDFMATAAENVGKKFDDLGADFQSTLRRYGLGAAEWDEIRQFEASVMGDADTFLRGRQPGVDAFPDNPKGSTIRDAGKVMAGSFAAPDLEPIRYLKPTDIKNEELALRYLEMIHSETERAVPSSTVANRAAWLGSTKPGTRSGEILRTITMLKTYSSIVMMQDAGRVASEIAAGRLKRGARFAATMTVSLTLYGALTLQLKALSKGEDPRDMTDHKFWEAALLQGGGLGLMGDYLFGQVNRFGGSWGDAAFGPLPARLRNLWNLTAGNFIQFGQDEPTNFGREAVTFARLNLSVPFYLRLAYERILLDEAQKLVDPQAHAAFRRKAQKLKSQFKTGYWWAPGETGPRRAPDWGNILPH